jgi:hypothetical protein
MTVLMPSDPTVHKGVTMSNPRRRQNRRWRARNAVAISVIFAGVTAGAVTSGTASAASESPAAASAAAPSTQQPQSSGALTADPVPVHGIADDGSALDGQFQLQRFQARDGVLVAVGKLTGTLGDKQVGQTVRLPVTTATNDAPADPASQPQGLQAVPTPGACSILSLHLGPLDLNLLGLRVALDPVNLLIEAIAGPSALLGNLLCAVAGLLDGGLGAGLGGLLNNVLMAIANLLNGLLTV